MFCFTDATSASGTLVNYIASAHDTVDGDRPVVIAVARAHLRRCRSRPQLTVKSNVVAM